MKKLLTVILLFVSGWCVGQELNNDLVLLKPLININDTNGGYYSEYFYNNFEQMFCGAIIENRGSTPSANVYLKLDFLDNNNAVFATFSSDTISILDTNQVDTLSIQQALVPDYNYNKISYTIISDSIDENQSDNSATIPFTSLYGSDWNQTSRADISTATLRINEVEDFQSGDFLGITLKYSGNWSHLSAGFQIYLNEPWPDSLSMVGKIYQNGNLIDSIPLFYQNQITPSWHYYYLGDFSFFQFHLDSLYYIGVELIYPEGTTVPLGVDTSYFHNFESETIAKIGNTWTTLDFVPLMRLVCDPEGINENDFSNTITLYPNPATNTLTLSTELKINNAHLKIMNAIGQEVYHSTFDIERSTLDISQLPQGLYYLHLQSAEGLAIKKFEVIH